MSGRPDRILVTGASGMLGTSLVPSLRTQGYEVFGHGHTSASDCTADLTDSAATHRLLDAILPDVVVNLVALTNVDQCEDQPDMAYRLNVRTVETLASWSGFAAGRHLVQLSTDQVYDGVGPFREDAVSITNTYALTKYAGELAAKLVHATILRTNLFGPSQHPTRRSFSDWILDNLRAGRDFVVFDDVLFSPLSFPTLNRMIGLTIARRRAGTFNLGSRQGLSKADFAAAVAAVRGYDPGSLRRGRTSDAGLRATRPKDMRMDVRAFEHAFDHQLPRLADEINLLSGGPC